MKPIPPPHITCPRVLEFRQLIQYKPLTAEQRQQISKAMQAYGEYLEKRKTGLDDLLPRDPRDESEKIVAEELDAKVSVRFSVVGVVAVGSEFIRSVSGRL